MVMFADLLWATFILRTNFFTGENKNIYFTPVDLQYCQGNLSCKSRIAILVIREWTIVVNAKIREI